MPQPSKIPLAFAASGDKNIIPESTETTGLASWREGFPAITSTPFSEGGIAPKRADFNGIFNALSQAVMWMQQGGVYVYDVNTNYEAGNVVLDAGGLYVANAANGPSSVVVQPSTDTTGAAWKLVRLGLATQSAAGYMSAEDKTKLDSVILTNATQSAAGYMSAEDKTVLDGVPTTYLPRSGGNITDGQTFLELSPGFIEISSEYPFIDFHHARSDVDYTVRFINIQNGQLQIIVKNDTDTEGKLFNLNASGGLTWDGQEITRLLYSYLFSGSFIFENVHNFQIIADHATASNGTVVNFGRAFASDFRPIVIAQHPGTATTANVRAYAISSTGFIVYSEYPYELEVNYIAIGKGQ